MKYKLNDTPGISFDDWLPEVLDGSAMVVDEELVKELRACVCYELPDRQVCFRDGFWGPLSEEQLKTACNGGKITKQDSGVTATYQIHNKCLAKTKDIADKDRRAREWTECVKEEMAKELGLEEG